MIKIFCKQLFYDKFDYSEICGMFTSGHFVALALFIISIIISLICSRKLSQEKAKRILLVIAIVVTLMEIIKIALRVYKGNHPNSWLPLYFCSLFIFAIWLTFSKNEFIKNMGYSFIVYGGIIASLSFMIYPSTSLVYFPLWHPASLHSIIYHFLMLYTGCLVLISNLYQIKAKHFLNYFCFTIIFCIIALVVNHFLGTNMMFISRSPAIPLLENIYEKSKILYTFLACVAQCVCLYWAMFGWLSIIEKIRRKNKEKNNGSI